jgi:hypothetical protein
LFTTPVVYLWFDRLQRAVRRQRAASEQGPRRISRGADASAQPKGIPL